MKLYGKLYFYNFDLQLPKIPKIDRLSLLFCTLLEVNFFIVKSTQNIDIDNYYYLHMYNRNFFPR